MPLRFSGSVSADDAFEEADELHEEEILRFLACGGVFPVGLELFVRSVSRERLFLSASRGRQCALSCFVFGCSRSLYRVLQEASDRLDGAHEPCDWPSRGGELSHCLGRIHGNGFLAMVRQIVRRSRAGDSLDFLDIRDCEIRFRGYRCIVFDLDDRPLTLSCSHCRRCSPSGAVGPLLENCYARRLFFRIVVDI